MPPPGEDKLLREVEDVLAVSPVAYESKRAAQPTETFQISTGVAFETFNRALRSDIEPPELQAVRHPIVGHAGTISAMRCDLELLAFLAKTNPRYSLVLVGPVEKDAREFFEANPLRNLHLLGPRAYAAIPHYLEHLDVCLIPYRLNNFNLGSNPVKLYEYLALGKPVVSTAIPAVQALASVVLIATDRGAFNRCLAEALAAKADSVAM